MAILVIIMTVMVQVFQAATGALTTAQTVHDLDNKLKLLDGTIRADLRARRPRSLHRWTL